jgi:hypothetical protein
MDPLPLQPGDVVELVKMLRLQSQAAIDLFQSISPQLLRHMGALRYEPLRRQVSELQFSEAANSLEALPREANRSRA